MNVYPTDDDALTALRKFLLGVLPAGVEVVEGQDNRVPEPKAADFVVMTMVRYQRLATNVGSDLDCAFVGSIAGGALTAQVPRIGAIGVGATVWGVGVAAGTTVVALGTGSGGAGTYSVQPSQTVALGPLSAGRKAMTQEAQLSVQLDVHGPQSANMAATITTLMRDEVAADMFAAINPAVSPLYADDPRQMPFVNGENQVESRWIVEAQLQVSQVVSAPQQYADSVVVSPIVPVDQFIPAP